MNVLILTKCIPVEEEFVKRLHMLGYEVFCSCALLSSLKNKISSDNITKYFQIIIISETVSDTEVESLLKRREFPSSILYRKSSSLTQVPQNMERQIQDIIITNEELESLREKLSQRNRNDAVSKLSDSSSLSKSDLESFIPFSKKEKMVFEILRDADGDIVSREEICGKIWSEVTHSNLAQISSIIKRIKIKFVDLGMDEDSVQTFWGKGYRLVQR
ncbi:winged helix-turn-helix domain-containing protein [Enterococcus pallens]|uniref:OmpR/PhoB-type domain-containing protein n=1 Tax=Enterococcus pallens ATCC BAA-351 TaxID=1158607 RepID=R2SYH7_9ENTE|nr:winged helix-turn-helix domain-containing protein [Enterococcus pallens]EOH93044.1 hypothetical protein UAU_02686 [Enterococcus pallens ATCC BAA-351]EOU24830.1 hypothetical protein I588_00817 [Enterococcus pallens ATCC BAA-351]OJG76269.1 hypothetical protein RV10_GL003875 [Enterococcus pallens]